MTKEDAWPVWLVKKVGVSRLIATMTGPDARAPYRTNRIEQRVGCACRQCNNGWMSDLEVLTMPILGPMIDGTPIELSGTQQVTLAAWMLKTLMVFDWLVGNPYWRQDEREVLFQRQLGPALKDCMTYAGLYDGGYKAFAYPRRPTVHRSGEDTGIPVFSGVLIAGRALLWLQTDRYREATGREGWLLPPRHFDRLLQLWGPGEPSVGWPPSVGFDDSALKEFLA